MKSKEWRVKSEELRVKGTNPGFDVGAASSCPHFEEIAKEKKNIRINSERYKFKEFDAITLISLVITIIILIILASVAINLTIGENGIFNKAKYAKKLYENAQERESEELNELYGQLLVASDGTINNISVQTLKELIQKEVKAELKNVSVAPNPAGSILAQMGEIAPEGYLICNGQEYNIEDYPQLSNYIKKQFGKYDYWGGNGTTTFAVPDLRGEFLRGTGTATRNSGTGTNVGIHQDATEHVYWGYNQNNDLWGQTSTKTLKDIVARNLDILKREEVTEGLYWRATGTFAGGGQSVYTARPTNTAVLYCIKY